MRRSELDEYGRVGAEEVLRVNEVHVDIKHSGTHVLHWKPEGGKPSRIGHGPDLLAACLDALSMMDEHSPPDLPVQALHLACLLTLDPAWTIRAVSTLYPPDHPVYVFAESEDEAEEDDVDEEIVEGSFEDTRRRS